LSVAVARALALAAHGPGSVGIDGIEAAAQAAERVFHGNPSGIDVALAARGGIGLYTRGEGFTPLPVRPFRIAIGLTGEPRDTAARVADVARRRAQDPVDTDRRLAILGGYAREAARGLDAALIGMLGELAPVIVLTRFFAPAQRELSELGLSSPGIDRLCAIAAELGAAAKLTGAGGGGAVIALSAGDEQRVVEAWRAAGFDARVVDLGVPATEVVL
jgi:mevalonate kinase